MKKNNIILFVLSLVLLVGSITYFSKASIVNPASVTTLTTGGAPTAGSVIFSDGTLFAQDNTNLFWNDSTNRLGISSSTPARVLSVDGDSIITGALKVGPLTATSTLVVQGTGVSSIAGSLGVASTTPFSEFGVESSSGTTTAAIGSGSKPTCLQLYTSGGTAYRVFLSDVNGAVTSEAGSCE